MYQVTKTTAETMTQEGNELTEKRLVISTDFRNNGLDYFSRFTKQIGPGKNSDGVVCSHV